MSVPSPYSPIRSAYIHVPFCARKCSYCAFFSEATQGDLMNRYVSALVRELELNAPDLKPATIFFGGGTPSLLNLRQWERILQSMERLDLLKAPEFTVECNPATISPEKARLLRGYGVNRISMGVQSLEESLLERLGRVHSRRMVFRSFDVLREAGFDNINLDLMFAIPGQSRAMWRRTLKEALRLDSEHLSCYEVIYEEDTPLFHQLKAGEFDVDEELACQLYDDLIDLAADHGFRQYEIANFARSRSGPQDELPDWACRHNVNYWRGGSFYGLGPSATGYVRGRRYRNWANTELYCAQLEQNRLPIEWQEQLPPLARAGETAAFGLRMNAGWPWDLFRLTTGFDLGREWRPELESLVEQGWGEQLHDRFRLTPQGLRFADAAAAEFLRNDPDTAPV